MTGYEIAWLAGLLEGEGSFGIMKRRLPHQRDGIRVQMSMTDRDVVERAAALAGGASVYHRSKPNPKHQAQWSISLNGVAAERVMRLVRPHMGERRGARIDELLALPNLSHHPRP